MIDFSLTTEQKLLQTTARDFAERVVRPGVARMEKSRFDKAIVHQAGREILAAGAEAGFLGLLIPEAYGGLGRPCIDLAILLEEIAAVDIAVAADLFSLTATMTQLVTAGGTPEQKERWLRPLASEPVLLSGALSEPDVAGSDLFNPDPNPALGVRTLARREGDHYVLNGAKSAFVTNGGAADLYFVMARTSLDRPLAETLTIFVVPAGAPGLSFAEPTALLGWHTSHHAQIFFDNVIVPVEDRLGEEGAAMALFGGCAYMPIGLAACFVGLARAAKEYAVEYAKLRKSWGKPIIAHQAVGLKLADMAVDVHAARLVVWEAAYMADSDPMTACTIRAPAAKSMAVDAAIKTAEKTVEVLGGYGVTREYKAGKFLNDAWVGYACDFTRDMLRLGLVPFL